MASLPGWWGLPAVRSGSVYVCGHSDLLTRPGPRIVDAMELLAALLHPAAFADLAPKTNGVMKLTLSQGQRCRSSVIGNFFQPIV